MFTGVISLFALTSSAETARDFINVKTPNRCYFPVKKAHLARSLVLVGLAKAAGEDADLEIKGVGFESLDTATYERVGACLAADSTQATAREIFRQLRDDHAFFNLVQAGQSLGIADISEMASDTLRCLVQHADSPVKLCEYFGKKRFDAQTQAVVERENCWRDDYELPLLDVHAVPSYISNVVLERKEGQEELKHDQTGAPRVEIRISSRPVPPAYQHLPMCLGVYMPDDLAERCDSCGDLFDLSNTKHHCRHCGHVFDSKCTQNALQLRAEDMCPPYGLPIRAHVTDLIATVWDDTKRLCTKCHNKLSVRESLVTRALMIMALPIPCLERLSATCEEWRLPAIYCLSTLFQVQSKRPTQSLTIYEQTMLLRNRKYWVGHSQWMVQFLKAVNWSNKTASAEAVAMLIQPRIVDCDQLCCSSLCRPTLTSADALELLSEAMPNEDVRRHAVECLKSASRLELRCFLSRLVFDLRYETCNGVHGSNSPLARFLLSLAVDKENEALEEGKKKPGLDDKSVMHRFNAGNVGTDAACFASELYWALKMAQESLQRSTQRLYSVLVEKLVCQLDSQLAASITRSSMLVAAFEQYSDDVARFGATGLDAFKTCLPRLVTSLRCVERPFVLPTDPRCCIADFHTDQLHVEASKTAPVMLPCIAVSSASPRKEGKASPGFILSKYKPEDLRKDQVVLSVIRLVDIVLKQELGLDLHIVAYNAVPTSAEGGLVQIVTEAATLYKITLNQQTLLTHILRHQKDSTISSVHAAFSHSLAAWTIIQFLLGIGDRHKDNIMVTQDAVIFHIDFGWVLGKDPKPLMPRVRLDKEMIDAIGGESDQTYQHYKDLCIRTFLCLRKHLPVFFRLLLLLPTADPPIKNLGCTVEYLERELSQRFFPGYSDEEAGAKLEYMMGESYEKLTVKIFTDWVHEAGKQHQDVVSRLLAAPWSVASGVRGYLGVAKSTA